MFDKKKCFATVIKKYFISLLPMWKMVNFILEVKNFKVNSYCEMLQHSLVGKAKEEQKWIIKKCLLG